MNVTAQDLIAGQVDLPTLPHIVAKINALVDDPNVGTREIGHAVSEDAPIAAKVLRIANSALYGLRQKVLSTEHATAILGVRQLRNIALQASVIRRYENLSSTPAFDLDRHWRNSILTGQMCAQLARRCRARIGLAPEEFQVIGLLLDMGRILMLESLGERYVEVLEQGLADGLQAHEVERRELGFDHAEVGALIAAKWGLPAPVIESIEMHHNDPADLGDNVVSVLVHHASRLAEALDARDLGGAREVFGESALRRLGLRAADVEQVLEHGGETLPKIEV